VDAAVRTARTRTGRPVANCAFALMEAPEGAVPARPASFTTFTLTDDALARKIGAALGYPEMAGEVSAARERWGDEAFRRETFRHVRDGEVWAPGDEAPYYERHGRNRVEEGVYPDVIRYDQHIRPLADLLHAQALREAS
jgi:hypothetical protein